MNIETTNRNRAISLYCYLTGRYADYCAKCAMRMDEHRHARYISERDADEFLGYITPAVERFCGDAFEKGLNPDALPHPLAIAMAIHHRRGALRESLAMLGKSAELSRVYALMKQHGMEAA